jgi:mRNA-degrading endonuclease toxin of MazEF toxin-antitoxin module
MSRRSLSTGSTLVVVPLTTNTQRARAHRVTIPASEIIKDIGCLSEIKDCTALCGQVATVDKQYFENRIGKLSQNAVLAIQLGLTYVFEIQ